MSLAGSESDFVARASAASAADSKAARVRLEKAKVTYAKERNVKFGASNSGDEWHKKIIREQRSIPTETGILTHIVMGPADDTVAKVAALYASLQSCCKQESDADSIKDYEQDLVHDLMFLNKSIGDLTPSAKLVHGTKLRVPGRRRSAIELAAFHETISLQTQKLQNTKPEYYIAEEDEMPIEIARKLGCKTADLVQMNRRWHPELAARSRLLEGTKLRIPGVTYLENVGLLNNPLPTASPPPSKRTASKRGKTKSKAAAKTRKQEPEKYIPYRHWTNPGEPTDTTAPSYMMAKKLHIRAGCARVGRTANDIFCADGCPTLTMTPKLRARLSSATPTLRTYLQHHARIAPPIAVKPEWRWASELRAAIGHIKDTQMVTCGFARDHSVSTVADSSKTAAQQTVADRTHPVQEWSKLFKTFVKVKPLACVGKSSDSVSSSKNPALNGFWHVASWPIPKPQKNRKPAPAAASPLPNAANDATVQPTTAQHTESPHNADSTKVTKVRSKRRQPTKLILPPPQWVDTACPNRPKKPPSAYLLFQVSTSCRSCNVVWHVLMR